VLATVALDLKPGLAIGTNITLAAVAGKALILNPPGSPDKTTGITISVGTLITE
jgi:hypothetical protein